MTTVPSSSTNSNAGPSRILRQPLALSVSEKPPPSSKRLSQPSSLETSSKSGPISEADALKAAVKRKIQLEKKVDRYMDRLMEETMDRATFRKHVAYLQPNQYLEVTHERHLNSLCSYPLCSNPPESPYRSHRRFLVSARDRTITELEGNAEEGFCSRICRARSSWVQSGLREEAVWLRSGNVGEVELLEDLEDRGEVDLSHGLAKGFKKPSLTKSSTPPTTVLKSTESNSLTETSKKATDELLHNDQHEFTNMLDTDQSPSEPPSKSQPEVRETPPPTSTPKNVTFLPTPAPSSSAITDLIASLTVHERPTPSTRPVPPSLSPLQSISSYPESSDVNAPIPPLTPNTGPTTVAAPNRTSNPTRRGAGSTSLLSISGSTSKLASSLLAVNKNMTAQQISMNQANVRVDEAMGIGVDSDESASEDEWAKEMGWGEGDEEVDALFEQARAARELAE